MSNLGLRFDISKLDARKHRNGFLAPFNVLKVEYHKSRCNLHSIHTVLLACA